MMTGGAEAGEEGGGGAGGKDKEGADDEEDANGKGNVVDVLALWDCPFVRSIIVGLEPAANGVLVKAGVGVALDEFEVDANGKDVMQEGKVQAAIEVPRDAVQGGDGGPEPCLVGAAGETIDNVLAKLSMDELSTFMGATAAGLSTGPSGAD